MLRKILFIFFILLAFFTYADGIYRVFDEKGRVKEYWKDKGDTIEIYNPDWTRKGYIKKKDGQLEFFDKDWRRKGYLNEDLEGKKNLEK